MEKVQKRNPIFSYLEALAIIMVIDDHVSTRINIFSNIFPYNSFYMPMLVFISGYFYKKQTIIQNIKHKFFHLFLPYVIWSLVGNGIAYLLMKCNIVYWYSPISWKSFYTLIAIGPISQINGASWFVVMLIWVSVGYNIIRQLIHYDSKITNYFLLAVSIVAGIVSLQLCLLGYSKNQYFLPFLRTLFYFQFYHMGTMFKKYWEKYIQKARTLYLCSLCSVINVILILIYGQKLNFCSTNEMSEFNSCIIPLITSVTGTLFWYKVMQFLASRIGSIKIIDFISENTFTIMEAHLFFANIPNFYVFYKIKTGSMSYPAFDTACFKQHPWIRYSPN